MWRSVRSWCARMRSAGNSRSAATSSARNSAMICQLEATRSVRASRGSPVVATAWNGYEGAHWADHHDRWIAVVGGINDELFAAAAITSDATVLDVGCGAGQTARLAARTARHGHVTGVASNSLLQAIGVRFAVDQAVASLAHASCKASRRDRARCRESCLWGEMSTTLRRRRAVTHLVRRWELGRLIRWCRQRRWSRGPRSLG
jgi:hypothetical protein